MSWAVDRDHGYEENMPLRNGFEEYRELAIDLETLGEIVREVIVCAAEPCKGARWLAPLVGPRSGGGEFLRFL